MGISISGRVVSMLFQTHKKKIPVRAKEPVYKYLMDTRSLFRQMKRIDRRQFDGPES